MSPVSRKRKPKKQRRSGQAGSGSWQRAVRQPGAPWWPSAAAEVLAGAERLLSADAPRQLEQATAELLGGVLHAALGRYQTGFALNAWLDTVSDETVTVASPQAWLLLHGIAAIAPPAQAEHARAGITALRGRVPSGPDWLATTAEVLPTGEVCLLRDAYGTRFAVIMRCGYPDPATDGFVYLLDVDTCAGLATVVDAGVHDGLNEACAAWRASVGLPAADATPGPADLKLLADLLPTSGLHEPGVMGDETRRQMDNYYRMVRRADDLTQVLAASGRPLPERTRWLQEAQEGLDVEPFVKDFQTWNATRSARPVKEEVEEEAVAALAEAWLEGSLPETRLSCSAHRIRILQEVIAIEWRDDPLVGPVAALLPQWVRWCAERTGLDPELTARAIAAAERHPTQWRPGDGHEPLVTPISE
jgi:hypothetical protein